MAITPKPIFQLVPSTTLAQALYKPALSARLELITFVNTDTVSRTINLYHDIDGETFSDATLVLSEVVIAKDERYVFEDRLLLDSAGSLGIQVDAADVITITGYAWEDVI